MSREDLMQVFQELPYSVSKSGIKEVDGVGNFVVLVEQPRYTPLRRIWINS